MNNSVKLLAWKNPEMQTETNRKKSQVNVTLR